MQNIVFSAQKKFQVLWSISFNLALSLLLVMKSSSSLISGLLTVKNPGEKDGPTCIWEQHF